jgi:hypothetical protein
MLRTKIEFVRKPPDLVSPYLVGSPGRTRETFDRGGVMHQGTAAAFPTPRHPQCGSHDMLQVLLQSASAVGHKAIRPQRCLYRAGALQDADTYASFCSMSSVAWLSHGASSGISTLRV